GDRRGQALASGAVPRSGLGPRVPQPAAHPRPHAGGAPPAGDAGLRDAVDGAPARALGGAGRGAHARGQRRPGAAPPGLPARRPGLRLVAPALAVLAAVTAFPALWVIWLSFQRRIPIFGIEQFEGLRNYTFLATDPRFWSAARVTLIFTVVSVGLELVLGLLVALALAGQRRGL